MNLPTRINLGSGKSFDASMLNIDINGYWNPDVVTDLSQPFDPSVVHETTRFGSIKLTPASFDSIIAIDVLEHVRDLVTLMSSCLTLLRVGGELQVKVPYDLSYGAWQDPTHVRAFNENSWLYYTEWFWYIGWTEARFDVTKLWFSYHPIGQRMAATGQPQDQIVRTPRAVDAMEVILRKRNLEPAEQAHVKAYLAHTN